MKKSLLILFVLLLCVSLFGCTNDTNNPAPQDQAGDEEAVTALVEDFGSRLQKVSLQAPPDIVKESLQEHYGNLVSPSLLAQWLQEPAAAPGRVLSSPWPERIEILNIEKLPDSAYEVRGEIIEITSVEKANGGVAAKQPIILIARKVENSWLITSFQPGAEGQSQATSYENTRYGFRFSLQESWQGYSIITDKWEGFAPGGDQAVASGPLLSIRHPEWTAQNQRQDIPIMVFTPEQWASLEQGKFHIGAAPIGPRELGRNTEYVFALPARYNYAFPPGYEEVEEILQGNPLQAEDRLLNN